MRDGKLIRANTLLNWYDQNARVLPWRVSPQDRAGGVLPDPYHVWLSEIMLQQTTVAAVKGYFVKFITRWPTVFDLANANDDDVMATWAGLGYYARARNLLKCARMVAYGLAGIFPSDEAGLQKLPGIGPYTSAAIASIAFDRLATVLDGNVERVTARFHLVYDPLPASKEKLRHLATQMLPKNRFGDYSQAIMDLGATVCTPRTPNCGACPWSENCKARAKGVARDLPNKQAKLKIPTRYGTCYVVIRRDGAVLLERRPNKGLLGGMLGWPGSEWSSDKAETRPPLQANWQLLQTEARHTFTHFHLRLSIKQAVVANDFAQNIGRFIDRESFDVDDLPTVMRKVWQLVAPVA